MIQIRKPSLKNKKGVELRNFFDNVSEACFVRISCRDVDNFCFDTIPFKKKDFIFIVQVIWNRLEKISFLYSHQIIQKK